MYEIVRNLVESKREKSSKYKRFKQAVLTHYGVHSPEELDPKTKKEFYRYIDKEWKRYKSQMQSDANQQM